MSSASNAYIADQITLVNGIYAHSKTEVTPEPMPVYPALQDTLARLVTAWERLATIEKGLCGEQEKMSAEAAQTPEDMNELVRRVGMEAEAVLSLAERIQKRLF